MVADSRPTQMILNLCHELHYFAIATQKTILQLIQVYSAYFLLRQTHAIFKRFSNRYTHFEQYCRSWRILYRTICDVYVSIAVCISVLASSCVWPWLYNKSFYYCLCFVLLIGGTHKAYNLRIVYILLMKLDQCCFHQQLATCNLFLSSCMSGYF